MISTFLLYFYLLFWVGILAGGALGFMLLLLEVEEALEFEFEFGEVVTVEPLAVVALELAGIVPEFRFCGEFGVVEPL